MNPFTQDQVRVLARQTGFGRANARIAGAVAMCESPAEFEGAIVANADHEGDHHLEDETWGPSVGLMMVRSLKIHLGTGRYRDFERLKDPAFNMRSALLIKRARGDWNPWSTFADGQYRAYLPKLFPPEPGTHVVIYGDTLSAIGTKYGVDWREIAVLNGIFSPYPLHIGQVLFLPLGATDA